MNMSYSVYVWNYSKRVKLVRFFTREDRPVGLWFLCYLYQSRLLHQFQANNGLISEGVFFYILFV